MRAPAITTSSDGHWTAIRRGAVVALLGRRPITGDADREVEERSPSPAQDPAALTELGRVELPTDDAEIHLVGPPSLLVIVVRGAAPQLWLVPPPQITEGGDVTPVEVVARLALDEPMRVAAVTGQRLVLVSADGKRVTIVRAAGKAFTPQTIDPGSAVELAVGLERNQLLLALHKKLEVWDAVSGRPLLRMALQLPPPPRNVGAALGHLWVTRPGSDEVFVYRLSDGRPFRHYAGSPVQDVICHPASPLLVLVTPRGLVRLNCFAHSLTLVEAPWTPGTPLALLGTGEDIALLGLGADAQPWRVSIGVAGTPVEQPDAPAAPPLPAEPAPTVRTLRERMSERGGATATPTTSEPEPARIAPPSAPSPSPSPSPLATVDRRPPLPGWRTALAAIGRELGTGVEVRIPDVDAASELAVLATRLGLSHGARQALAALYAAYLQGEPALPIARLALLLGDWTESLGRGELAALGLLERRGGRVALRDEVGAILDGAPPTHVRLVGDAGTRCEGAFRVGREGKSDATLESELATQLGRIAIVEGDPDRAILEARLHGATAVAFAPPEHRPRPWPRGASLVLVLYGSATSWVADLPALTAS